MTKAEVQEHTFLEGESVLYHGQEAEIVHIYPDGATIKRKGGSYITVIYSEIQIIK